MNSAAIANALHIPIRGLTFARPEALYLLGAIAILLAWWLWQARTPARSIAPVLRAIVLALFVAAGLVHGYALAESIVGAEPAPFYAYFAGLVIVQSGIALGAMLVVREITIASGKVAAIRFIGARIAGIGIALVVQQIASGA